MNILERRFGGAEFRSIIELLRKNREQNRKIMSAIQDLSDAVTKISGSVDEVIAVLKTPAPNDGDIKSATDTVNAVNDRLRAALDEVSPPPVEEPPLEPLRAVTQSAQVRSVAQAQARTTVPVRSAADIRSAKARGPVGLRR